MRTYQLPTSPIPDHVPTPPLRWRLAATLVVALCAGCSPAPGSSQRSSIASKVRLENIEPVDMPFVKYMYNMFDDGKEALFFAPGVRSVRSRIGW